jgi:hypothetical protein
MELPLIRIDPEACDSREVVIEKRQPDGSWKCVSTTFPCSHTAGEAFVVMVSIAYGAAMIGSIPISEIPKLEDYRLAFTDDIVNDMSQACDILNKIKDKK